MREFLMLQDIPNGYLLLATAISFVGFFKAEGAFGFAAGILTFELILRLVAA